MANFRQLYMDYILEIDRVLRSSDRNFIEHAPHSSWLDSNVHPDVIHNSRSLGRHQYKELIFNNILRPQTKIIPHKILVDGDHVSALLRFTVPTSCTTYLGYDLLPPGQRVKHRLSGELAVLEDDEVIGEFDVYEQVMYQFAIDGKDGKWKIKQIWSVVDLEPLWKNGVLRE